MCIHPVNETHYNSSDSGAVAVRKAMQYNRTPTHFILAIKKNCFRVSYIDNIYLNNASSAFYLLTHLFKKTDDGFKKVDP